jgi:hypothetical protein
MKDMGNILSIPEIIARILAYFSRDKLNPIRNIVTAMGREKREISNNNT